MFDIFAAILLRKLIIIDNLTIYLISFPIEL